LKGCRVREKIIFFDLLKKLLKRSQGGDLGNHRDKRFSVIWASRRDEKQKVSP